MKLKRRNKSEFIRDRSPYSQQLNEGGNDAQDEECKQTDGKKVDFEQKNLERLEALKAKKAQEQKEIEE